jgi:hypothetical protein
MTEKAAVKEPEVSTPVIEVVPDEVAQDEALAIRSQATVIDQLSRLDNAVAIIERRTAMMESLRVAAIRRTNPSDWVLTKPRVGDEFAMLTAAGARKVSEVYGIGLRPIPPATSLEPQKVEQKGGKYSYRIRAIAYSNVNGQEVEIEAERRNDEEFTGRSVDADNNLKPRGVQALDSDLRSATYQLALTKAARVLGGMIRVAGVELDSIWKGTDKSTAKCVKGHGYGTSGDRAAESVAEEGVAEAAAALRDELLRLTNGDASAAGQLLKDITANPDKSFTGFTNVQKFTAGWQVEAARKKLAKHPVFGSKREPGEEG